MTSRKILPNAIKASLTLIAAIFALALALRFFHLDRALGGNDENAMLLYFGYAPLKIIVTHYWDVNNHIFHAAQFCPVCFCSNLAHVSRRVTVRLKTKAPGRDSFESTQK